MAWRPHFGAQEKFLSRSEFEVLFGGAAGPGKTDCLIAGMTRDVDKPNYRGLLLRRTFPQLQEIMDRCHGLYPQLGGTFRATEKRWFFPSGAHITLGHMQHEVDKYNYLGKEFHRVGFDELTQFTESQYSFIINSRIRTTDPDIQCQTLSTTNPGGIGHWWVKERFQPDKRAMKPYVDPKSGLTRIFIPATVEDNPTLFDNDPDYLTRLEALPEIEKMRLRYGVWDAFEGQAFPELSMRVHGCEPFDIPPEWERYCILDWGYAKPFSVGWYAIDYDDVVYRYREWYGCKKEAEQSEEGADVGLKLQAWEVAKGILDRENGEKIRLRLADPSIFHPREAKRSREARGVTIAEDFTNEGVYFRKADNDRIHGKLQVHKRFQLDEEIDEATGEILSENPRVQIFNNCHGFWRTMMNLVEDEKNPEDIDTRQEDHCLHGSTLVVTRNGQRAIRSLVGTIGEVLTIDGKWTRYWGCRRTRVDAQVVRVRFDDGRELVCTQDHKLLSFDGRWVEAKDFMDEFGYNSIPCGSLSSAEQFRNLTVSGTTCAAITSSTKAEGCIVPFGMSIAATFLKGFTFITRTIADLTTRLRILSCEIGESISRITLRETTTLSGLHQCTVVLGHGMEAMTADGGTASISRSISGRYFPERSKRNALNAGNPFQLHTHSVTRLSSVPDVARPVRCVSVEPAGRADVYCLVADETHCFAVEGGIVVHNCFDEFRYMCMARPIVPKRVVTVPTGSFQAERSKLIRARKHARAYGVSMAEAYRRIR